MTRPTSSAIMGYVAILGAVVTGLAAQPYGLAMNFTASAPSGFYLSERFSGRVLRHDEYVSFKYAEPSWARGRGYLPSPDIRLLKLVRGVPGETIRRAGLTYYVCSSANTELSACRALPAASESDSKGRPVTPYGAEGMAEVLGATSYFLASPYPLKMSLDSRYLGPVQSKDIEKTFRPLLTWSSE